MFYCLHDDNKGDNIMKGTEQHNITYKGKQVSIKFEMLRELSTSGADQIRMTLPNGMTCTVTGIDWSYRFEYKRHKFDLKSEELNEIIIKMIRKYRYV